jgi:hypothetical protein
MKLEHKTDKLATIPKFVNRLLRYTLVAGLLIFTSILIGVLGYYYFGGLGLLDSFYMASMILTGMGPVVEMRTNVAKVFSSFYALYSGVAFLSITAVFFAPVIHRLMHILHIEQLDKK